MASIYLLRYPSRPPELPATFSGDIPAGFTMTAYVTIYSHGFLSDLAKNPLIKTITEEYARLARVSKETVGDSFGFKCSLMDAILLEWLCKHPDMKPQQESMQRMAESAFEAVDFNIPYYLYYAW